MRVVMPAEAGIIRFARHKLLAFNAKIALSVTFFQQNKGARLPTYKTIVLKLHPLTTCGNDVISAGCDT